MRLISCTASLILIGCGQVDDNSETIQDLQKDISDLQEGISALQKENGELRDQLDKVYGEVFDNQGTSEDLDDDVSNVSELDSRISDNENNIDSNTNNITDNSVAIANNKVNLDNAESNISTLQTDLSSTRIELDIAEDNISTLQSDLASTQSDLNTAKSSLSTLESDLTTAEADISDLLTDVSALEDSAEETLDGVDWALWEYRRDALRSTYDVGHQGFLLATSGGAFHQSGNMEISTGSITADWYYYVTFYVTNPSSSTKSITWDFCRGDNSTIYIDGSEFSSPSDLNGTCSNISSFNLSPGDHEIRIEYTDSNNLFEGIGVANSWISDNDLEMDYDGLQSALAAGL